MKTFLHLLSSHTVVHPLLLTSATFDKNRLFYVKFCDVKAKKQPHSVGKERRERGRQRNHQQLFSKGAEYAALLREAGRSVMSLVVFAELLVGLFVHELLEVLEV